MTKDREALAPVMAGSRARVVALLVSLVVAGCASPAPADEPEPVPDESTDERCATLEARATPETAPAGQARTLRAALTNCDDAPIRLSHACLRGMDLRILVLYNSTTPDVAVPDGVGPKASIPVDAAIAGLPLACATAPPHVRVVAPGATLVHEVAWSGLYAPPGCGRAACARVLEPGRYLLAAEAIDADTGEARLAAAWMTLT